MGLLELITIATLSGLPYWAQDAQARTGLDARLIYAVCMVESGGQEGTYTHHDGGSPSYGQCQVKEATARFMGFKGQAQELLDPGINAYWSAKYLSRQLKRYQTLHKALQAYNAGQPGRGNGAYADRVIAVYRRLR